MRKKLDPNELVRNELVNSKCKSKLLVLVNVKKLPSEQSTDYMIARICSRNPKHRFLLFPNAIHGNPLKTSKSQKVSED